MRFIGCLLLVILIVAEINCQYDFDIFIKFYTKENHDGSPVFLHNETLNKQYFCYLNPSFCSNFMIVHGFQSGADADWVNEMKDELFKKNPNSNVFLVDWSKGAQTGYLKYEKAAKNIKQVYPQIADLIVKKIEENFLFIDREAKTLSMHCIGHSLGAHTCGLFSKYLKSTQNLKLTRITGLDPAGPCFEYSGESNRLDKSDAIYVDVVHTSSLFGILKSIGHTDFYPNAGKKQPDCWPFGISRQEMEFSKFTASQILCNKEIQYDIINSTDAKISAGSICSHSRAYSYFIESINSNCTFSSLRCSSWSNYEKGLCNSCEENMMGYSSNQMSTPTFYYLKVNSEKPFCIEQQSSMSTTPQQQSSTGFFKTNDQQRKKTSTYKNNDICLYSNGFRNHPFYFVYLSIYLFFFFLVF